MESVLMVELMTRGLREERRDWREMTDGERWRERDERGRMRLKKTTLEGIHTLSHVLFSLSL